jgi:hypothetical protein
LTTFQHFFESNRYKIIGITKFDWLNAVWLEPTKPFHERMSLFYFWRTIFVKEFDIILRETIKMASPR